MIEEVIDTGGFMNLDAATELGFLGFFLSTYLIVIIGWVVIGFIAHWKIFEKADVDGWKAIVPILNFWEMIKIAGLNPVMILLCLIPGINFLFGIYLAYKFVESYGFGFGGFLLYVLFGPIMMLYMGFSSEVRYTGTYYNY